MGYNTARCGRSGDGDATGGSGPSDKIRLRASRMDYSEIRRIRIHLTWQMQMQVQEAQ